MRLSIAVVVAAGASLLVLEGCAQIPVAPPTVATPSPPPAPSSAPAPPPPSPPPAARALVPLSELQGWADEDHAAALQAFRAGCGVAKAPSWRAACQRARQQTAVDEASARAFFEDNFKADLRPASGLLTAYFAPEYPARDRPDGIFSAPVLPRPEDPAPPDPDAVEALLGKAVKPADTDGFVLPDRAEIEAEPVSRALAFMKPEDLFFMQVQGSGVLVFADGRHEKAVYAADNGRPFVGIARPMTDLGLLPNNRTSGEAIRSWLALHRGPEANAIMDKNPRYVFFSLVADDSRDPAGAAGVSLPAGRSLAVDPSYHAYGELYWIDAAAPVLTGAVKSYRRLAVALDTGSAIRGDVRADLYLGRGETAGEEAGHVRHSLLLVRLVPVKSEGQASGFRHEKDPQS